jgi:hypothetical protein
VGTTEQQILRVLYQWGGEASKTTIESELQIMLGNELAALKGNGLVHVNGSSIVLTPKGITTIESNNFVATAMVQTNAKAREMVRKALKSVLEHDSQGYNLTMAEARKQFTPRYVAAVEKYYALNLP